jgi:SAM-dependent methyltransferase
MPDLYLLGFARSYNGVTVVYDEQLGFHRIDPYPSPDEVAEYYESDQFYGSHSPPDWFEKESREYVSGLWDSYFQYLIRAFRPKKADPYYVIDIGCGGGIFANYWGRFLPFDFVAGVEPSAEGRRWFESHNSDIDVFPTIESLHCYNDLEINPPDGVSLILVLEHVPQPTLYLQAVVKMLPKGGRVLIVVPNDFNPLQQRLNYYGFISPVHVNYFTPATLRGLMVSAGLQVVHESSTFPMEMFPLMKINYFGNDRLGRRCHAWRLRLEKFFGWGIFKLYERLYQKWGIGRELVFVGEKV